MLSKRDNSAISTVIGLVFVGVAIVGTTVLDWTWSNPDGKLLPLLIGVGAAVVGAIVIGRKVRN